MLEDEMKIIIIDDDKIVCKSLEMILSQDENIDVLAQGYSYDDAVSLYQKHRPDVMLLDINLGEKTGLMAAREILKLDPEAKILFLTTFTDNKYIYEALQIGARGYILKQDFESITPSIKAVFAGQNVFGAEVVNKLPKAFTGNKELLKKYNLTDKENEILENIAKGYNNKEIASQMFLSEGTVRNYITTLLEKLQLRDRTQLAIFYYNAMAFGDRD